MADCFFEPLFIFFFAANHFLATLYLVWHRRYCT